MAVDSRSTTTAPHAYRAAGEEGQHAREGAEGRAATARAPRRSRAPATSVDARLRLRERSGAHGLAAVVQGARQVHALRDGADVRQLRLIGGPTVLQQYLDSLGFTAIHQQDSEHTLHGDQKLQYRDYAEPTAMVALLRLFADHSPLDPEHTALLNTWMLEATSGPQRIKGLLPSGTPVAHKTGSSGEEFGMIPATNDVGLITLPDGRRLAVAIFVTDAHADQATCETVIARIARVIYERAVAKAN